MFATEAECEKFGIGGSARCIKENNCYRPDEFRIIVDWDGDPDDAFGNDDFSAFILTKGSVSTNALSHGLYSVDAGTYDIKFRSTYIRYIPDDCMDGPQYIPGCFNVVKLQDNCHSYTSSLPTSLPSYQDMKCKYIEQFEMTDVNGNKLASFDPRNQGDEQDLYFKNYPLTMEAETCSYYYDYAYGREETKTIAVPSFKSTYTFKGGITYYVTLPTTLNDYYKCLEVK